MTVRLNWERTRDSLLTQAAQAKTEHPCACADGECCRTCLRGCHHNYNDKPQGDDNG